MIVTPNPNSELNAQPNLINHFVKIWLGVESINSNPSIRSQRPTKSNQSFRQKMPRRRQSIDDKVTTYLNGKKGEDYVIANNGKNETKTKILELRQNIIGETFQQQVHAFSRLFMNWWSMNGNQWQYFYSYIYNHNHTKQFDLEEINSLTQLVSAISLIENLKLVTGLLNLDQDWWLEYWLDRLRKHVCTVIYLAVEYNPRSISSKEIEEM
jgi:hypothetical protein